MNDTDILRVSSHEHEVQLLLAKYPMLSRAELMHVIDGHGPMRDAVESELTRLSATKR
jgi:hypothetical protein